jgi:hypothetical protein
VSPDDAEDILDERLQKTLAELTAGEFLDAERLQKLRP